jgi:uncharacterized protein YoaH (UPF0181 family)
VNGHTLKGYSVFVHVARSQLVVELMSLNSDRLSQYDQFLYHSEPRMTVERIKHFLAQGFHSDVVVASVSRAVSDLTVLEKVEKFYLEGVGATKTMSLDESVDLPSDDDSAQSGGGGEYTLMRSKRCFQWPHSESDICFTTYTGTWSDGSEKWMEKLGWMGRITHGSFTPKMFEDMLHESHEYWLRGNPSCANDKWIDNHYAVV